MAEKEQGRLILQEEDVRVQLEPASRKKRWGSRIGYGVVGVPAGWAIHKKLSDRFLSQIEVRDISSLQDIGDVEIGEAKDLKKKKVDRVVLMDDAIHMFYRTGLFRKTYKMFSFPLEYVTDIGEAGKIMKKVQVTLDLPKDEEGKETEKFNLQLGVDDLDEWIGRLKETLQV